MATAQAIKENILRYLSRVDATDIPETLWFEIAHREIQRQHNFRCMEATAATITLLAGALEYAEPTTDHLGAALVIKSFRWKAQGTLLGVKKKTFHRCSYDDWEEMYLKFQSDQVVNAEIFVERFAPYRGKIFVWPKPGTGGTGTLAVYDQLVLQCWRFLSAPVGTATNWFTEHAEDYLLYRSLLESVSYIPQPPELVTVWEAKCEKAFQLIKDYDVAGSIGEFRERG